MREETSRVANNSIKTEWCLVSLEGTQAERAMLLGSFYKLENGGKGASAFFVGAFLRPIDEPRPHHLKLIEDPILLQKLWEWHDKK